MPATKIVVNLPGEESYDVRVGAGLVEGLGAACRRTAAMAEVRRAIVISDANVAPLYLEGVKTSLRSAGYRACDVVVPEGEESKTLAVAGEIWEAMATLGLGRDSAVVALGGGVVGDLAGFVAANYLRGVPLVQVPTTLLAMVDSSVGGKTGVNLAAGKNLVGAFKQPVHVCMSTDVLVTLDEREWRCGCAELAKAAFIDSDEFFFWLLDHAGELAGRDAALAAEAVVRAVTFKASVVARDVRETQGVRECLNYGHTLAHALEKTAGYGTLSHGEAVAEGMRFAARLAEDILGAPSALAQAQAELLDGLGLPALDLAASGIPHDVEALIEAMHRDKKVRAGELRFVLASDVGDWGVVEVDDEVVREHLEMWLAR